MGILNEIGKKHGTDKSTIFHQYCDFYQKELPGRDFTGRLLEIGVWTGASIRMWAEYYPLAQIVGVDIEIRSEPVEGVTLIQMDASDTAALSTLGSFDVIVDDGSHMCSHQQIAFNHLFERQMNDGGLYVMEDAQTSLWEQYQDTPRTTLELLREIPGVKEYNREGQSITLIVPKNI